MVNEVLVNGLSDFLVTGRIGMNTIREVHCGVTSHSFQQERNQRDILLICQILKLFGKFTGVFNPIVGGHFHAGKQGRDVFGFSCKNDFLEVIFSLFDRDATKSIIPPQSEDEKVRF